MKVVCMICHSTLREIPGGEGVSHGACPSCLRIMYPEYDIPMRPALMKPKADRYTDCRVCQLGDLDEDGVPDGCRQLIGQPCIAPGKRMPWDNPVRISLL